ncbi:hypothetical protein Tco_1402359 [Tanacetum coccineum]
MGKDLLTLDFHTFCSSTGLDYNNGKYVAHLVPEVLEGNYSSTEQVNSIQQLLAYSLITGIEVDIGEIIYISSGTVPDPQDLERDIQLASTGLPSTLDEGTRQSKSLPKGTATHPKDSGGNKQPLDRDITSTTSNEGTAKTKPCLEGNGAKYQVDETQSTRLRYWSLTKNKGKTSSEVEPDTKPLKLQTYADIQAFLLSDDELDKDSDEEEVLAAGDDMDGDPQNDKEASVDQYYDENIAHRDQADKLVEASMSSLDKSSTTISDLYKVKGFDFYAILSAVKSLRDHAVKQEEASTTLMKSKDTSKIKSMMTEMYAAFQGHPSSAPSGSVTLTLALTDIQVKVEGENANTATTKETPSHTKGETEEPRLAILISSIPSTIIPQTQS